jgi:hypothetical protein
MAIPHYLALLVMMVHLGIEFCDIWCNTTDIDIAKKFTKIVGAYLNPWVITLVPLQL